MVNLKEGKLVMSNQGCQQLLIKVDKNLQAILEFVCGELAIATARVLTRG